MGEWKSDCCASRRCAGLRGAGLLPVELLRPASSAAVDGGVDGMRGARGEYCMGDWCGEGTAEPTSVTLAAQLGGFQLRALTLEAGVDGAAEAAAEAVAEAAAEAAAEESVVVAVTAAAAIRRGDESSEPPGTPWAPVHADDDDAPAVPPPPPPPPSPPARATARACWTAARSNAGECRIAMTSSTA